MHPSTLTLISDFKTWLLTHRATSTTNLRVYHIQRISRWAAPTHILDLEQKHLSDWLLKSIGPAASTKRSARDSLKVFFAWAHAARLTDSNPTDNLPSMRAPIGVPHPTPDDALNQALARARRPSDILMIALAAYQGLRASELAHLHTNDIEASTLRVRGKGGKTRLVPLHETSRQLLHTLPTGWVFPSTKNISGHMLPASIGQRIRDLFGNVPGLNAHSLRHKFACDTLEARPDLMALRDLLGHQSVATTQIYTRASATRLQEMVATLPPRNDLLRKLRQLADT